MRLKFYLFVSVCSFYAQSVLADPFPLVDTFDDLKVVCKKISAQPFVAIDLEFKDNKLCLIQACWGEGEKDGALIDYLALHRKKSRKLSHALGNFRGILKNPLITKVFHAPAHDIRILYALTGELPRPVADTQAMYATVRPKFSASYASVVKDLLDEDVDKSQQCSSWMSRPLNMEQLIYASADVSYLYKLYPLLYRELLMSGRTALMDEYSERQCRLSKYIKTGQKTDADSQIPIENIETQEFVRTLMAQLQKKAEELSMAPQILATRSDLTSALKDDLNPLIESERVKLLGWGFQELLERYQKRPYHTMAWSKVMQGIRNTVKLVKTCIEDGAVDS
ncbi:MAG: hypothetical protein JSR85_01040 [Proteobacteria bacterium]|nr:hypothetical protein [Pseudomonadota bacterium]